MKAVLICKDYEKLRDLLQSNGSFSVEFAFESVASGLDVLKNNLVQVDKFIVVRNRQVDLKNEVRGILSLLDTPSGLLTVEEFSFIYKTSEDDDKNRNLIELVSNYIQKKSKQNPYWTVPVVSQYSVKNTDFDVLFRTIMGTSSKTSFTSSIERKYRVEKENNSIKAFEPNRDVQAITSVDYTNLSRYLSLKDKVSKTENPSLQVDTLDNIPTYDNMSLNLYKNTSQYTKSKWVIFSGIAGSGASTHITAMSLSAIAAQKSLLSLDLSSNGGLVDYYNIANNKPRVLSHTDMLNSTIVSETGSFYCYENNSREVLYRLLSFIQSRSNIFNLDLIFVNCDLTQLGYVLGAINPKFCTVILSSLLFTDKIQQTLKIDTMGANTLIWMNDNVNSPLRKNKLTLESVKTRAKAIKWRTISPVMFQDFDVDARLYDALERIM